MTDLQWKKLINHHRLLLVTHLRYELLQYFTDYDFVEPYVSKPKRTVAFYGFGLHKGQYRASVVVMIAQNGFHLHYYSPYNETIFYQNHSLYSPHWNFTEEEEKVLKEFFSEIVGLMRSHE